MLEGRERRKAYELRERMLELRAPRVLVADDDPDVRGLVAATLRLDGYGVVEARDGAELLEYVGSALLFGHVVGDLEPVTLVISDIRMPGHSGLEILAGLRRADIEVAVILLSAYDNCETRLRAADLGADAFVPKPFEIDALRAVVRELAPAIEPIDDPASWRTR